LMDLHRLASSKGCRGQEKSETMLIKYSSKAMLLQLLVYEPCDREGV
jgi:hypothetical protein